MYSHRLSWLLSSNRYSARVSELRAVGTHLIDLSSSNPTSAGFDYPHASIGAALGGAACYAYEPDARGALAARESIASYYEARGINVPASRILLSASTSEAYGYLFKLLCDPQDEVLIPSPSYPLFEYLAALESVRTVPYWVRYDGSWHIDFSSLLDRITSKTRAIVVVNPNNPTGSFLKRDEAARLNDIAALRGLAVISDEVFFDYPLRDAEGRARSLIASGKSALTFSLNGLSKAAGMPQMKLGWMVLSGSDAEVTRALRRLELILDTYLSVNTPVQLCLPDLLQAGQMLSRQILERIRRNLSALETALAGSAAHPLYTEAGWSVIVQVPRTQIEDEWLFALLNQEHVIAQPGYFFDMASEAYLVLSLITRPADFDEGVARLKRLVEKA